MSICIACHVVLFYISECSLTTRYLRSLANNVPRFVSSSRVVDGDDRCTVGDVHGSHLLRVCCRVVLGEEVGQVECAWPPMYDELPLAHSVSNPV